MRDRGREKEREREGEREKDRERERGRVREGREQSRRIVLGGMLTLEPLANIGAIFRIE